MGLSDENLIRKQERDFGIFKVLTITHFLSDKHNLDLRKEQDILKKGESLEINVIKLRLANQTE